ncbi:MAG TPA: LemA family protein [Mycobacteriales bacterium]|jgi:LemA protein|nr:LemA family protein [Mycobacteriales bacterium]
MKLLILVSAGILVVGVAAWFLTVFNRLVKRRNNVEASWGQIDVQLVRRHDLIPNLVATVQGYVAHERATLQAVTAARAQAITASGPAGRGDAEAGLTGALHGLFGLAEAYPDLKASQNFLALQHELANTENRITYARQFYNDAVLGLNNQVQSFPSMIVAGTAGFKVHEYFQAGLDARAPANVRF